MARLNLNKIKKDLNIKTKTFSNIMTTKHCVQLDSKEYGQLVKNLDFKAHPTYRVSVYAHDDVVIILDTMRMTVLNHIVIRHRKDGVKFYVNVSNGYDKVSDNEYLSVVINENEVSVHRIVAEAYAGRTVLASESVHHKDRVKVNNSTDNLVIMDHQAHIELHRAERRGR